MENIQTDKLPRKRGNRILPALPKRVTEEVGQNTLLNVDILKVDHTYQRPADLYHIAAMAHNFDLKKLFRIAVNKRPNGDYYIMDGQQRVGAIRMLGGNYDIDCVVYHLDTVEQEAALYYHLNWDRKAPNSYDRWKARLAQNDPDIVRIQNELDQASLKLAYSGNTLRTIKAVGTLMLWTDFDIETLSVVIMILGKFNYMEPLGSEVFSGLCAAEHHLRANSLSMTRARSARETYANHLIAKGYSTVREACNRFQGERVGLGGGSTVSKKAAKGIIHLLNYNMKTKHLPQIEE